jgi:two-component system response regulator MprA
MQVNRWIRNGDLDSFRNPGGHYRVPKKAFRSFLERNSMPVIEDFFREQKGKRILIADDDRDLVEAIRMILKKQLVESRIEVAHDGYDALIKAGDFKPDLLILDIRMPKIDGLEICRRVRENGALVSTMKILAITGHSDAYDRETVLASGADDYLLKPFDMQNLFSRVDALIR